MAAYYQVLASALLLYCAPVQANVFGDGDPGNGAEDDRQGLNSPLAPGRPLDSWRNSAGTIHCEGRDRGSAMVLDVREFDPRARGTFLATAAHVLVELASGRAFEDCEFHYLALNQLPRYRSRIDRRWIRAGAFDANEDVQSPAFGRNDWAFIWLPPGRQDPVAAGRVQPAAYAAVPARAGDHVSFLLVAYDRGAGALSVSAPCYAVQSRPGDLGGGAWQGQLLDDCDSGDGASGGGLILRSEGEPMLVGIRTGSHWSPERYPPMEYPTGPPAGALWDVRHNTNFARAIDLGMLEVLRELVLSTWTWTPRTAAASE